MDGVCRSAFFSVWFVPVWRVTRHWNPSQQPYQSHESIYGRHQSVKNVLYKAVIWRRVVGGPRLSQNIRR